VLLLFIIPPAFAVLPPCVTDKDLAKCPVIAVAHWEKGAAFKQHAKTEKRDYDERQEDVVVAIETLTEIVVEKVVKGDLKPGRYTILMGPFIGWADDGRVMSYTSSEMTGDAKDVTKPNIWFLDKAQSWDTADKTEYLKLGTYRGIQPLVLEPYFSVLVSKTADDDIGKLLQNRETEVVLRALDYICGGMDRSSVSEKEQKPLRQYADAVCDLLKSDSAIIRQRAARDYALLAGIKCVPKMRELLEDKDFFVRGTAILELARHQDNQSCEGICRAAKGIQDGRMGCDVVGMLEKWNNPDVVPAIIEFLQNDKFVYLIHDDLGIPALQAKAALKAITGHDFPFDVEKSLTAWRRAVEVPDKEGRLNILKELLPDGQTPVSACVVGSGENASIEVANVSKGDIFIAKTPADVQLRYPPYLSRTNDEEVGKTIPFVKLAPGETVSFDIKLSADFLRVDPATREVTLRYTHNGNENGINAWIGMVKATFGRGWKEPERKWEKVEEKWPNGNFKVVGQTMNGQKCGKWEYYSEAGDRIRIVDYEGGTAECNPEHPDNKGAGIPKPSGQ